MSEGLSLYLHRAPACYPIQRSHLALSFEVDAADERVWRRGHQFYTQEGEHGAKRREQEICGHDGG
eukprot:7733745-Pyramimonas_sp.AAC.1